jgi:hypothetical protein
LNDGGDVGVAGRSTRKQLAKALRAIELDGLLAASATAAQMEALMENYGRVWPDIQGRAINSPDHFKSLTRALVISGMTPQDAQAKIGSREE